jgi:alpha-L-fucosidase
MNLAFGRSTSPRAPKRVLAGAVIALVAVGGLATATAATAVGPQASKAGSGAATTACKDQVAKKSADSTTYDATKESLDTHPVPKWWSNDKFGIFIHWGAYSVPAYAPPGQPFIGYAEWYWFYQQLANTATYQHHLDTYGQDLVYDDFIPQWKAEKWNPKQWVKLIKESGAKYFVLTTKHHDGLALWPTKTTDRNTVNMGPKRDLVGDMVDAACGSGLRTGLYYSIPEFFNPAPKPDLPAVNLGDTPFKIAQPAHNAYTGVPSTYTGYKEIADYASGQVTPQIEELVERYRPSIIWCDIGGVESYFRSNAWIADYYNTTKQTNPDGVVVDDRCGDETTHSDYNTVEYGQGSPTATKPREVIRGMGFSFGYNAEETDADYATTDTLVDQLVDTVANNGNFLLDIGPKADGTIPAVQIDRLKGIGAWLKINGAAIYDTKPWAQPGDGSQRYTQSDDGTFYVTALEWPGAELTVTAPIPVPIGAKITLLGSDGKALKYRTEGTTLVVTTPGADAATATTSQGAYVFAISKKA